MLICFHFLSFAIICCQTLKYINLYMCVCRQFMKVIHVISSFVRWILPKTVYGMWMTLKIILGITVGGCAKARNICFNLWMCAGPSQPTGGDPALIVLLFQLVSFFSLHAYLHLSMHVPAWFEFIRLFPGGVEQKTCRISICDIGLNNTSRAFFWAVSQVDGRCFSGSGGVDVCGGWCWQWLWQLWWWRGSGDFIAWCSKHVFPVAEGRRKHPNQY